MMPEISSAEEAIEKAREVLNKMGHSVHIVLESIPGKEAYEDVWIVPVMTIAGKLEIILRKRDGIVVVVRKKE